MTQYDHYILDFDRTLFDREKFNVALDEVPASFTPAIWDTYDVNDFLYPDVSDFLAAIKDTKISIVSVYKEQYGPVAEAFQRRKISDSLVAEAADNIYIMSGLKGETVRNISYASEATVFIDDDLNQLADVATQAPAVTGVWIDRPTAQIERIVSGTYQTITTLTALIT